MKNNKTKIINELYDIISEENDVNREKVVKQAVMDLHKAYQQFVKTRIKIGDIFEKNTDATYAVRDWENQIMKAETNLKKFITFIYDKLQKNNWNLPKKA